MHIFIGENPKFQKETPAAAASARIHGAGIPHGVNVNEVSRVQIANWDLCIL